MVKHGRGALIWRACMRAMVVALALGLSMGLGVHAGLGAGFGVRTALAAGAHEHDGISFTEWTDGLAKSHGGDRGTSKSGKVETTASNSLPNEGALGSDTGDSIYLTKDVKFVKSTDWFEELWSPSYPWNLCLNGKTVTNDGSVHNGRPLIWTGQTVSIYDHTGSGTIGNNTKGRGVLATTRGLILYGGNIANNYAGSDNGAGVLVKGDGGYLELYGGSIKNNTTTGKGAGVYVEQGGELRISGTPKVEGNKANNKDSNVYLAAGVVATINGPLESGARIGISMENPGTFTSGWKDQMGSADPSAYFTSDDANYVVSLDENGEVMLAARNIVFHANFADASPATAVQGIANASTSSVQLIASPWSRDGYELLGWATDSGATVPVVINKGTYTLPSGATTVDLYAVWAESHVHDGITFSTWTDALASERGGERGSGSIETTAANSLPATGSLGMDRADSIYLTQDVTFAKAKSSWDWDEELWAPDLPWNLCLNGATVTNDGAVRNGRPLIWTTNSVSIYDHTGQGMIGGNKKGRGVLATGGRGLTLYSGDIAYNNAGSDNGAGVLVKGDGGYLELYGGSIINNTTTGKGAGVYVEQGGQLSISGAPRVESNKANGAASNIYLASGVVATISGKLTGSAAHIGISMEAPGTFTSGWKAQMGDADPSQYFFSDDPAYHVVLDANGEAMLTTDGSTPSPVPTPGTNPDAQTFTVHFDGNGDAVNSMADQAFTVGSAKNLSTNAFSLAGHVFSGWATDPAGQGTRYHNREFVKDIAGAGETITLYAQWKEISYALRFAANGGMGSMPAMNLSYNQEYTLPGCAFTRTGYSFAGWKDAQGVLYTEGDTVKQLADSQPAIVTLYAQWVRTSLIATFDANGGEGGPGTIAQFLFYGDKLADLEEVAELPTRDGFLFAGWYADKEGKQAFDLSTPLTENVTLYAKWVEKKAPVIDEDGEPVETDDDGNPVIDDEGHHIKIDDEGKPVVDEDTGDPIVYDKEGNPVEDDAITEKAKEYKDKVFKTLHVITFDSAGGTAVDPQQVYDGDKVTEPADPTRYGHSFSGWYLDGAAYDFGKSLTKNDGDFTLVAAWTPETHNVATDVTMKVVDQVTENKGGTVTVDPTEGVPVDSIVSFAIEKDEGYRLVEFSVTDEKGAEVVYHDKGELTAQAEEISEAADRYEFKMPASNVTIKAVFTPITYAIMFRPSVVLAEGSENMPVMMVAYDIAEPLADNVYVRPGYKFVGWNDAVDFSGTTYADKQEVVNLSSEESDIVTLYAMWEKEDEPAPTPVSPDDSNKGTETPDNGNNQNNGQNNNQGNNTQTGTTTQSGTTTKSSTTAKAQLPATSDPASLAAILALAGSGVTAVAAGAIRRRRK